MKKILFTAITAVALTAFYSCTSDHAEPSNEYDKGGARDPSPENTQGDNGYKGNYSDTTDAGK